MKTLYRTIKNLEDSIKACDKVIQNASLDPKRDKQLIAYMLWLKEVSYPKEINLLKGLR